MSKPIVAIIGKPNAGKSSLINKILGEERVIVSNIPGTTRDAIDTYVTKDDQDFCFIDTAFQYLQLLVQFLTETALCVFLLVA